MGSESPVFAAAGCFSFPGRFRRRSRRPPRRSRAGGERDYISRHPAGHRRHLGTDCRAGPASAHSPLPAVFLGPRRMPRSPPWAGTAPARKSDSSWTCECRPDTISPARPARGPGRGHGGGQGWAGLRRRWWSGCSERGCWQGSAAFRSCKRGGRVCQKCPLGRSSRAGDRGDEVWQGGNRMILDRFACERRLKISGFHLASENPVNGVLFWGFIHVDTKFV